MDKIEGDFLIFEEDELLSQIYARVIRNVVEGEVVVVTNLDNFKKFSSEGVFTGVVMGFPFHAYEIEKSVQNFLDKNMFSRIMVVESESLLFNRFISWLRENYSDRFEVLTRPFTKEAFVRKLKSLAEQKVSWDLDSGNEGDDTREFAESGEFIIGVPEYLQLASMMRHSFILKVQMKDGRKGKIYVVNGEVWDAEIEGRDNPHDALRVMLFGDVKSTFTKVLKDFPERKIMEDTNSIMLNLAKDYDEKQML